MICYRNTDNDMDYSVEEGGYLSSHWAEESCRCKEELASWKEFREYQRKLPVDRVGTELQLSNTDPRLVEPLTRVGDWQQFRVFQNRKVDDAVSMKERCQYALAKNQEGDAEYAGTGKFNYWRLELGERQDKLDAAEKDLKRVKEQYLEILSELSDLLASTPKLRQELEEKLEHQSNAIYERLRRLGARPSRSVSLPNGVDDYLQRLYHWTAETLYFEEELYDWRCLLAWREGVKGARTTTERGAEQTPRTPLGLDLWQDAVEYRQHVLDRSSSWLDCWRRLMRWYETNEEISPDKGLQSSCGRYASQARIHVELARQMVSSATIRLEQLKQGLASASSECNHPTSNEVPPKDLKDLLPPTPPQTSSESPEFLLRDGKTSILNTTPSSGRQSHRPKNTISNGALGPIHSAKINKATKKIPSKRTNVMVEKLAKVAVATDPLQRPAEFTAINPNTSRLPDRGTNSANTASNNVLGSIHSTKVTKSNRGKTGGKPRIFTEQQTTALLSSSPALPLRRSTRLPKIDSKKPGTNILGPIHATKITKATRKKPAKQPQKFTEQKVTAILSSSSSAQLPPRRSIRNTHPQQKQPSAIKNSVTTQSSPTTTTAAQDNIPVRRSERLRQKALSSMPDTNLQLNSVQGSRISKRKRPKK